MQSGHQIWRASERSDNFLFATRDRLITGWRGALGTTAETLAINSPASATYTGLAIATNVLGNTYLYAASLRSGAIDVFKGTSGQPALTGNFTDPNRPAGYAPFNIQPLSGQLYVTYAQQDAAKFSPVAAAMALSIFSRSMATW